MAIVKATAKGVEELQLDPNFPIKADGPVAVSFRTAAYRMKESQARLLGFPSQYIDYQMRNYGMCLIHEAYLEVV